jgi:hypothetical protein
MGNFYIRSMIVFSFLFAQLVYPMEEQTQSCFSLSEEDLEKNTLEELRTIIKNALDKDRSISSITIQGFPPIPREKMERLLKLDEFFFFVCTWENSPQKVLIDPLLHEKSEYFIGQISFLKQNHSPLKLSHGKINKFIISPNIMELINKNIHDDFKSLRLEDEDPEKNIPNDLLVAADYLGIAPLLRKIEASVYHDYQGIKSLEKYSDIQKDNAYRQAVEAHSSYQVVTTFNNCNQATFDHAVNLYPSMGNFPYLQKLCEQVFKRFLSDNQDNVPMMKSIIARLKELEATVENKSINSIISTLTLTDINDKDLEEVVELVPFLTDLTHYGYSVTNASGATFKKLTQLQSLHICGPDLTDTFFLSLENLSRLKSLTINPNNHFTAAIWPSLLKLPLENLEISNCNNLMDPPPPSSECPNQLKKLGISSCNFTNDISNLFENSSNITTLDFCCCKGLTNDLGPALRGLTNLTELHFSNCEHVTDIIPYVRDLAALTSLDLSCSDFSRQQKPMAKTLRNLTQLVELSLANCSGMDGVLNNLPRELKRLDLWLAKLTDTCFKQIAESQGLGNSLEYLNLANCKALTDDIGSVIKHFIQLNHLNVCKNKITAASGGWIGCLTKLRHLNLYNNNLGDTILPSIAQLTSLEVLNLSECGCSQREIIKYLSTLPLLDVNSGCEIFLPKKYTN